jgi:hypothetical protein
LKDHGFGILKPRDLHQKSNRFPVLLVLPLDMDIHLKTGQIIKIISLIPKPFHARHLIVTSPGGSRLSAIKIYFSDTKKELENKNFDDLAYIEFKPDASKAKDKFTPVYNNLEKAYEYCWIETNKPEAEPLEIVMDYEGL